MGVIGTNIVALRAASALNVAQADMARSMQRLMTGKRINSPADDPAGFAISVGMTSQTRGMAQAIRNAQDGIGLAQVAEGALTEVGAMAQRVRELAVSAASGSYSDSDRANMDAEVKQLTAQMIDTLRGSNFNGKSLFDITTGGPGTSRPIQVGPYSGDVFNLDIENIDMGWTSALTVGTASGADAALTTMDDFLKKVTTMRAGLGAKQTRLDATISNLSTGMMNMTEAIGRIVDTDYAAESMALARAQVMAQSSTAMLAQANQMQRDMVRTLLPA